MKSFYEFSEMMNENNAIDEGLFKTLGGWADKGAALGAKGIARGADAAVSGLGQGVMQGVKRGFEVAKQGKAANQIANMRAKMEKAINSGDPKQFEMVAKEIYKNLKAMQQANQPPAAPKAPVAANITPNASPSQRAQKLGGAIKQGAASIKDDGEGWGQKAWGKWRANA